MKEELFFLIKHDIGKSLKLLRSNSNISQRELSDKVFLSKSTISRFENNTQSPAIDELVTYLSGIDVSLSDYFSKALELSDESQKINNAIQKVLLHYQEYKNYKLNLIQKDLLFLKEVYDNVNDRNFNTYLPVEKYIQLHILYPKYFTKIDKNVINKKSTNILKKKCWLLSDYNYIVVTIQYMSPNDLMFLSERIIHTDYQNLSNYERRAYNTIIENLTDNLLIRRKDYQKININVQLILSKLFKFWDYYSSRYPNIENILIKQHNHTLFEMAFNKENKFTSYQEAKRRCELLKTLDLGYLADMMLQELDNFKHDVTTENSYLISTI